MSVLTIPHAMLLAMAPLSAAELPAAMPVAVPATQAAASAADPQAIPAPPGDPATTAATPAERKQYADQLVADSQDLVHRIKDLEFKPDQLGNGAKELLDEVATGKVTGEEEAWSHTDLWDFQANVDGARRAYEALRPIVVVKDPALAATLDERFASLQTGLDAYKTPGGGFVVYTDLKPEQVKNLADAVNALGEPLSKLTSVVVL